MSVRWKGISLPWDGTLKNFFNLKSDSRILKTSMLFSILTGKGERVMRPDFGSNISNLVFEPNNMSLGSEIESESRSAIRHDDRIQVTEVQVSSEAHNVSCKVFFKDATNPDSLSENIEFSPTS